MVNMFRIVLNENILALSCGCILQKWKVQLLVAAQVIGHLPVICPIHMKEYQFSSDINFIHECIALYLVLLGHSIETPIIIKIQNKLYKYKSVLRMDVMCEEVSSESGK